jgi:hypothetical protein
LRAENYAYSSVSNLISFSETTLFLLKQQQQQHDTNEISKTIGIKAAPKIRAIIGSEQPGTMQIITKYADTKA